MGEKISKSWENNKNLDSYIQIASVLASPLKKLKMENRNNVRVL